MITTLEWLAARKGSGPLLRLVSSPASVVRTEHIQRGDGGHSLSGTSLGMDTISSRLAVRVMRNPLASASCSALAFGSGWRSPHALWTDVERGSDRG